VAPAIATLGLRAHSGWAALVAISGSLDSPSVVERRILQLANPTTPGSKQPYHAAEPLEFAAASKLLERCTEETTQLSTTALRTTVAKLQKGGFTVAGCGLVVKAEKTPPSLDRILASHALIHAAEGRFFRDALVHAAGNCSLALTRVLERELVAKVAAVVDCPTEQLLNRLAQIGRPLGSPWREDQKYATLAAWIALDDITTHRPTRRAAAD
jgi:hypothetical protein